MHQSTSYLFICSCRPVRLNPLPLLALATHLLHVELCATSRPGLTPLKTKNILIYIMSPVARMTMWHHKVMAAPTQSPRHGKGMTLVALMTLTLALILGPKLPQTFVTFSTILGKKGFANCAGKFFYILGSSVS